MKTINIRIPGFIAILAMAVMTVFTSCKDTKSYAELLNDETQKVNNFLADQRVDNTIPTDTNFVFETGPNAPYYRLDEDGNIYMQVLNPGTKGLYAKPEQIVYFRFTRYNLNLYNNGVLPSGDGNEGDLTSGNAWFRFGNYTLESSYRWGSGLQMPLQFLPIDCEVNIVIKSQYGFYSETVLVIPFLYSVRYFPQVT